MLNLALGTIIKQVIISQIKKKEKIIIIKMSSFVDLFEATIGSLTSSKQELIEVISTTPIHDILTIFKNNNITSIPIYEFTQQGDQQGDQQAQQQGQEATNTENNINPLITQGKKYLGIISMVDILSFILTSGDDDTNDSLSHQVKYVLGSTTESLNINLSIESEDTPLSVIVEKMSQGRRSNHSNSSFI